jgi:hypothetical protein
MIDVVEQPWLAPNAVAEAEREEVEGKASGSQRRGAETWYPESTKPMLLGL